MASQTSNGHLDELSPDQYTALQKLRDRVTDVLKPDQDDFYLLRWLRARQFDVKKAEDMLRKNVAWRQRYAADHILTSWQCPEVLTKYDIGGQIGHDKQGRPVWIYKPACLDTKGIQCSVNRREIFKQYIHKMESCFADFKIQTEKLGRRVDKAVMIIDMEGFGWSDIFKAGMDIMLRILGMVESNYPEALIKAYIVNASSIFPMIFKICKPFINEETRKRIEILGSDWKQKLLEEIEASELPVHWGGTRTDPVNGDNYCSSIIQMGGTVPEECYLKGPQLVDAALIKTVNVGPAQNTDVEFKVEKPKVTLRYTFWTDDYDIKFGASRKKDDGTLEEVVRSTKYNSHIVPEDGVIQCNEPATYVFQFDNSYSWFHGKDVHYALQAFDTSDMRETSPE